MEHLLSKITAIILAPIFALSGFVQGFFTAPAPQTQQDEAPISGSISNSFVGGLSYSLSGAGVGSTDTSIRLTSFKLPVTSTNIAITDFSGGTGYGTLEPGNRNKQEFISFTGVTQNADGSATLTGVTRGLSPVTPYAETTAYKQTHAGGSLFIISDSPKLYQAIIDYIDGVSLAGVTDATTLIKGVSELATAAEAAASTATGGSGPLVLPASLATSTFNTLTSPTRIPVTLGTGKIDDFFISTTTLFANMTPTGTTTLATSTTLIGSFRAYEIGKHTTMLTSTGTSTFAVPSGVTRLYIEGCAGGGTGGGADGSGEGGSGGGAGGCFRENIDVSATTSIQYYVGTTGQRTTFGTIGFDFASALPGTAGTDPSSSLAGGAGGCSTNGDYSTCGESGGNGLAAGTVSGRGGDTIFGGGVPAKVGAGDGTACSVGTNGSYGGGGQGGASSGSGNNGGAGCQGAIRVVY